VPRAGPEGSLAGSSPAIGLLATFARSEAEAQSASLMRNPTQIHEAAGTLDRADEEVLVRDTSVQSVVHVSVSSPY
jgi:hypothetical protein